MLVARVLLTTAALALPCASANAAPPVASNPLDAQRAMGYLTAVCDLGPRVSGSEGMRRQQRLIAEHFKQLERKIVAQRFSVRHPLAKSRRDPPVPMINLIARWRPDLRERVVVCCHYDTRPLPDQDPNPRARESGTFLGANDGGSGVAVLMELAHHLNAIDDDLPVGVDLVFFDGEELVYAERGDYFHGSTHFARRYKKLRQSRDAPYRYRAGVLLDMVGDADLQVYIERNSYWWRDTRPVVNAVWGTAERLGVREFIPRAKHEVRDDHVPLRNVGGIPTCDVIDFDYPYWHTEQDVPANCSGESLAKVGWVVLEWIKSQPPAADASKP